MGFRPLVRRLGLGTLCLAVLATGFVAPAAAHGCQHTTTANLTTSTGTTASATAAGAPTTATGTTSCSTADTTSETRSAGSGETTATAHTAHTTDTQRSEGGGGHDSVLWKLTTIQFLSGTSMVLAGGALWAAVLAYRGTD
ncbi:hypothetical protein [Halococcus sp. IIIV-5B]|uniref:hypothetical protein n=1 Tax=Halococcus sp. IIIV-5B TaxID=2321230 RepID=UPI0011C35319|nr:hypothetical protein [Halococcus sp. IIIV-5B]